MSKFKCDICGKEYKSETWYQKHLKKHDQEPKTKIERIEEKDIPKEEKLEQMYEAVREFNKSLKNLDETNQSINFDVSGEYIAVVFISDLHYGNENVDMEFVDRLIEFVRDHERAYAVLNGDIIDNWVKLSPSGGEYEQSLKPEYQNEIITHKLEPIKDSILAVIYGNHEGRSQKQGEKNPAKVMAEKLDVAYLGPGGRLNLNFNGFKYKLHIRHKFRYESSFNPCHACGRLIEQLDSEAHVVGIGHKHDPAIEVRYKAGTQRTLLRFGSAMPSTKYSNYLGYNATPLVAPTVILSGQKFMHHPFLDISIVKQYIERRR